MKRIREAVKVRHLPLIKGVRSSDSGDTTITSVGCRSSMRAAPGEAGFPKSSIPNLLCLNFQVIHMTSSIDCITPATRNVNQLVQFVPGLQEEIIRQSQQLEKTFVIQGRTVKQYPKSSTQLRGSVYTSLVCSTLLPAYVYTYVSIAVRIEWLRARRM